MKRLQIHVRVRVDITTLEHSDCRQIQNAKIEEHRLMFCIPGVERKSLIPRETIPPVNLRPPCDTGPDRVPQSFTIR
jgi:hypothetical protein